MAQCVRAMCDGLSDVRNVCLCVCKFRKHAFQPNFWLLYDLSWFAHFFQFLNLWIVAYSISFDENCCAFIWISFWQSHSWTNHCWFSFGNSVITDTLLFHLFLYEQQNLLLTTQYAHNVSLTVNVSGNNIEMETC